MNLQNDDRNLLKFLYILVNYGKISRNLKLREKNIYFEYVTSVSILNFMWPTFEMTW